MPNRINHVKLVTPRPDLVNAFLTQVCDIPEGWQIGADQLVIGPEVPLGPGGQLPMSAVGERRGATERAGYITGDARSRQLQVFLGETGTFWAVCISTRDVEKIHQRATERGVPCTPVAVADWTEHDQIRYFFCLVGDLVWEVMTVEGANEAL
jgi:hypothetical protein